jgi:hypothetical protein
MKTASPNSVTHSAPRIPVNRREVLRAGGVALSLPFFEAMTPALPAMPPRATPAMPIARQSPKRATRCS